MNSKLLSLSPKNVHVQSDLPGICGAIWNDLHPLLPATALLLAWRDSLATQECLEVCGQTSQAPLHEFLTRDLYPDSPLWKAFLKDGIWLENSWSGGLSGLRFRSAFLRFRATTRR